MNPSSPNPYDVAVVGGGPAGSSAALYLAKRGLNSALIEKASLPRYKACGGGVARRAIQLLPIDVKEVIECDCYTVNLNLLDAGIHLSVKRQEPIISMTMRERFDFLLLSAAKNAGADVRSKCQVFDLAMKADKVDLVTSQGKLQARFVIGADGATSIVARKTGWRKHQNIVPGLEYEVFVPRDELRRFSGVARFDLGIVPHGYAWIFPKKGHLSVGVGSAKRWTMNLRRRMEQYFKMIGLNAIERVERHGFIIPVSPREGGFVRGRVLLTGDAAGFADPFSGEGITFAIQSGQMAAKALIDGEFDADRVKELYHEEIKKRILSELRLARALAKLIHDHPGMRTCLFQFYGQRFVEDLSDVIMGKIGYSGMLPKPLRWFRQFGFGSKLLTS